MPSRPLTGLRIIDLTQVFAGPYCSYLLGLLGAEVIKVELPGGEWSRTQGPPGAARDAGLAAGFATQAAGKRMLAVDIRTPQGSAILRDLLRTADVFVENLTPGTISRLGFDEDSLRALNPRLVFVSISGFGQTGPFAAWPAFDHIIQAVSGLMSVTGTKEAAPLRVGPPVVDYATGAYAAFAVMAALAQRAVDGGFQRVDLSMWDCAQALMSSTISAHLNAGVTPRPEGNVAASGSPSSGVFDTADGKLALAANFEPQYRRLCVALGRGDLLTDPRFAERATRLVHADALRTELSTTFAARPAAAWEALLMTADVPAGRVRTIPEAVAEPHTTARGVWQAVAPGESMAMTLPGLPFRLNGSVTGPSAMPGGVGTDTDAVLLALGRTVAEIETLRRDGVVG
ncbi:CaiB/BaiF CoA-transferase family protein [Acidisphaera sp. S103]|uniref:CaiB/BaiF CoA transferase family protein n=1 Tax=Acidisphaera sp. S103 TaxID=1747223 RepID=UPI00131B1429|nr:CoA transferase [Acidisphaera sp. S103]